MEIEETNMLLSLENKAYEIAHLLGKNEYQKEKIEKFFLALGQLSDYEKNEGKDPSVAYFKAIKGWLLRVGSSAATSERLVQILHDIEWENEAETIKALCRIKKKIYKSQFNTNRRISPQPSRIKIFLIITSILIVLILVMIISIFLFHTLNFSQDSSIESTLTVNEKANFETILTICSFYNLDYSIPKKLLEKFPINYSKYPTKFNNGEYSIILREKTILYDILNSHSNLTSPSITYKGIRTAFDALINPLLNISPLDKGELNSFYPHLLSLAIHYEHYANYDFDQEENQENQEELKFLLLLKMTIFHYKLKSPSENMVEVSRKLVELEKRIYGEYSSDYETAMGILAGFYYISAQEEKATNLYEQCYKIGEFNNKAHLIDGERDDKSNISNVMAVREIDLWKSLLQNSQDELSQIEMGNILNRFGSLTEQITLEPNIAKHYFARALEIFHELFGKEHPSYRNILLKYDRLK